VREFSWTPDKVATLLRLFGEGATYTDIMAAVGCASRSMVCGKILRLRQQGVIASASRPRGGDRTAKTRSRQTPGMAHVPLIKARHGEGRTDREIAEEIGIKPDDVRHIRRSHGLKGNIPTSVSAVPAHAAQLRDLVVAGETDGEIAKVLNITVHQVRYERRRQGLKAPALTPRPSKPVTTIVMGDPGGKVAKVFAEGFMGQRSRVDITGLGTGICHFPIDQPDGGLRFCGDEAAPGQVYCGHHAARCYATTAIAKARRPMHVYGTVR